MIEPSCPTDDGEVKPEFDKVLRSREHGNRLIIDPDSILGICDLLPLDHPCMHCARRQKYPNYDGTLLGKAQRRLGGKKCAGKTKLFLVTLSVFAKKQSRIAGSRKERYTPRGIEAGEQKLISTKSYQFFQEFETEFFGL